MKKKTALLAFACLSIWTTAHAVDCSKPPFGDSTKKYQQFVLNGQVASKGNLQLAQFITMVGRSELMSACDAKFHHQGVRRYAQMGLSVADLANYSVVQIAAYAINWKTRREAEALQAATQPKTVTVQQFEIDGPKLASEGVKVLVSGAYLKEGRGIGYLYANSAAILMKNRSEDPVYAPRIALLTRDASEKARTKLLECSEDPGAAMVGCSVTVVGTATTCEQENAFGAKRSLPCIDVKDVR